MDAYMTDISLLPQVLTIIVLLIGMILLMGMLLLPDAESETWPVRLYQGFMLKRTRLSKVLEQSGTDVDDYIHALSIKDLKTQRQNCVGCRSFCFCDRQRKRHQLSYGDLAFCPNRDAIAPMLKSKTAT